MRTATFKKYYIFVHIIRCITSSTNNYYALPTFAPIHVVRGRVRFENKISSRFEILLYYVLKSSPIYSHCCCHAMLFLSRRYCRTSRTMFSCCSRTILILLFEPPDAGLNCISISTAKTNRSNYFRRYNDLYFTQVINYTNG